ncbi:MAG: class D sortase [Defluviitaleaceae bacterium]|nr:class D sortase [Defluviitaleaceae bacterium]
MRKPFKISTALIIAGGVLVTLALASELITYPWFMKGTEAELPDPPPPPIAVITYAEYIEHIRDGTPSGDITEHRILPGGDIENVIVPDEVVSDETTTDEVLFIQLPSDTAEYADTNVMLRYVLLGSVKIPRLNVSENLFMGTESQVNFGVGHLTGTPLPGEAGNSVIAAHRTARNGIQPFRHLDLLREGDAVIVEVNGESFTYTVYESFIVHESATWVLRSIESETHVLTLVTCDPVVTVTRRDNRLIVRARLQ